MRGCYIVCFELSEDQSNLPVFNTIAGPKMTVPTYNIWKRKKATYNLIKEKNQELAKASLIRNLSNAPLLTLI